MWVGSCASHEANAGSGPSSADPSVAQAVVTDTSAERRTMKIDTKYWKIYRTDAEGKVIQPPLAEADTPEELWKLHPQLEATTTRFITSARGSTRFKFVEAGD